ncbi:MAG TPA: MFS transporter [Syntrophorhabdaceae bacterium]|jgi:OFA family oxalate/formate antiporter-like MFS transporter
MEKRVIGVVTAGFFTLFIAFAVRYSYGLILPYMLSTLAISKTEAGVIFSSYFVTATIFSPLMGILADRFNTKLILTVFVAILGAGTCLMSFSSSVVQASIFFAIIGIGHSACWAPVVAVVMRWVSPKRRGIAISVVDLGTTVGIAVWSVIVPIIIRDHSWRTVWLALGVTALVVAGMNFFLIKNHPETPAGVQERVQVPVKRSYKVVFGDPKFYLIGFSYLCISFSILIPFTFLTSYATQKLTIPYASATGLLLVIAVAGTIGKLILGHVSDKVGRLEIMMLCGLLTAFGAFGMAYSHQLSTLCIVSAIFGIGYGTLWAVYAASARDLFPADYSGSIIGFWTLFHGLGSIIAPILSGWIIDRTGAYTWAFVMAASASLLSLLLLLPVRRLSRKSEM